MRKYQITKEEMIELRKVKSLREIAKQYGAGERTIFRMAKEWGLTKPGRTPLTTEEKERILELYKQGFSQDKIGTVMQCSQSIVSRIVRGVK